MARDSLDLGGAPPARPALPATERDPSAILEIYRRRPEAHPYGIADVAQLWESSRWWRDGDAVVGLLALPDWPKPVVYAIAAEPGGDRATLHLLRRLDAALPERFVATGPRGLALALAPEYAATFARPYVKMHLAQPGDLPPPDPGVVTLTRRDAGALARLFATDRAAADFFHPGLLDSGLYMGRWDGGEIVAAGGIHVIDRRHGVAAIGNVVTHPERRRRGLGRAVVATLAQRLREHVATVGLNVRETNVAARDLYRSLGFRTVLPYEEAGLVRRRPPS